MDIKTTVAAPIGLGLMVLCQGAFADGWDPISQAGAINSIADTRHNLTMTYNSSGAAMNSFRNDYGAICVYCHTPHGSNDLIQAPLWNRTINPGNYVTYDRPTTLMRPIGLPGPSSLTCLSCHDGTITIDSILNMPGSGLGAADGSTNFKSGNSNLNFLNQWSGDGPKTGNHLVLGPELGQTKDGCAFCHDGSLLPIGVPDFRAFMLGTDLRNDHPVGVQFPDTFGPGIDFNEPNVKIPGRMAFFDKNGNGHADTNEVRLYESGDGYEVECASCHDPHGVPSAGTGTRFNPSFLRVNNGIAVNPAKTAGTDGITSNGASALCLTCHAK